MLILKPTEKDEVYAQRAVDALLKLHAGAIYEKTVHMMLKGTAPDAVVAQGHQQYINSAQVTIDKMKEMIEYLSWTYLDDAYDDFDWVDEED